MKSITSDGMDELIKTIFKQGMEKQMPDILGKANQSGSIPQSSTTGVMLTNDLLARLSGVAQQALLGQQSAAGQLAVNYAELLRGPVQTSGRKGGLFS